VVPPELVWEAAQARDIAAFTADWIAGRVIVESPAPALRL
jgi:hypothetical protein